MAVPTRRLGTLGRTMRARPVRRAVETVALLAAVSVLVAMTPAPVAAVSGQWTEQDVTYCTRPDGALGMDIFLPPHPGGVVPAVLFVHGGGWAAGDARHATLLPQIADALTQRGIAFATIDYRLAPRDPYPAQLDDVQCALDFIRTSGPSLGIDPTRLAAWGESAGGHLVAMLAETDEGGSAAAGSPLRAVVDWYGPTDLDGFAANSDLAPVINLVFGAWPGSHSAVLRSASPALHARAGLPPFLIVQGSEDSLVPPKQSSEFDAALQRNGVSSQLITVERAGHDFSQPLFFGSDPSESDIVEQTVAFVLAKLA